MPDFHAVQCYECSAFQVQQVKKVNKFVCSLCGSKQSVRRAYATSSKARDVRKIVQQLNLQRGASEDLDGAADETERCCLPKPAAAPLMPKQVQVEWKAFMQEEAPLRAFEDSGATGITTELPERQRSSGITSSSKRSAAGLPNGGKRCSKRTRWPSESEPDENLLSFHASESSQWQDQEQGALKVPHSKAPNRYGAAETAGRAETPAWAVQEGPHLNSIQARHTPAASKWAAYEEKIPNAARPCSDPDRSKYWAKRGGAERDKAVDAILSWKF